MKIINTKTNYLNFIYILFAIFFLFATSADATTVLDLVYLKGTTEPDTRGGIYMDDTYIWIAAHKASGGLWRAEICDEEPFDTAGQTTENDGELWDLWHSGSYIYGVGGKGFYIYDDKDGTNPGKVVGSITNLSENAYGIYATGNYAYLASDAGLMVYNISTPSSPSYKTTVESAHDFVKVRGDEDGDYLYVNDYVNSTMNVFDIRSTPDTPVLVGTYDPNAPGNPGINGEIRGLFVDDPNDLVYFVNFSGDMYIVDVSTPTAPVTEGFIFLSGGDSNFPAAGVYVRGDFAFIATAIGNDQGLLYWIDITDTEHPFEIMHIYDAEMGFNEPYAPEDSCWVHIAAHDGWKVFRITGYQPDNHIKNDSDTSYIGDDIYNDNGEGQTKAQGVAASQKATFQIKVENDSERNDEFTLEDITTSIPSGWTVEYKVLGVDKTSEIMGGTYTTGELSAGSSIIVTLEITPDGTVIPMCLDISFRAISSECPDDCDSAGSEDVVVAQVCKGTGSIGDFIWDDADGEGDQDEVSAGIESVTVNLVGAGNDGTLDTADDVTYTQVTDASGAYDFTNLPPGNYRIEVDESTLPIGYILTTGNEPLTISPLADGGDYNDADFGYWERATIGDYVWNDTNSDGIQDSGEPGISGVTVELQDGACTPGSTCSTLTTDANGYYLFTNLGAGSYIVDVNETTLPTGLTLTTANEPYAKTLSAKEHDTNADFGYQGTGSLGDLIWNDENHDGIKGGAEAGIENVTVKLYKDVTGNGELGNDDILLTTQITDSNGAYDFTGLPVGNYLIEVDKSTLPAGVNQTGDPDVLGTCDQDTGECDSLHAKTLGNGEDYDAADFGYRANAVVSGLIWIDTNEDGIRDGGETGRLDGLTVNLYDSNDNLIKTATTDVNGEYLYENLLEGNYYVEFSLELTYVYSDMDQGSNDAIDSDANPVTGKTGIFSLGASQEKRDVDSGQIANKATVGNYVWVDADNDGIQDAAENGYSGATVELYTTGDSLVGTTTTDSDGFYLFTGVAPGNYYVKVTVPSGFTFTTKDQGSDDAMDSDANASTGETDPITLSGGMVDTTWDIGLQAASIGDYIWLDENGNGVQDAGESGIPNVTVELQNGCTPSVDCPTTVTDANGYYIFSDAAAGNHTVVVDSSTLPTGLAANPTYDEDGTGTAHQSGVTVTAGEEHLTADFGYNWTSPVDNSNPSFGATGAIGDRIWNDANGDGVQDPGESGISGVIVKLYDDSNGDGVYDNEVASTTTDATGNYIFDGLYPDSYVVRVTPPGSYTQTGDPDSTLDNQTTAPVVVAPGDVFVNADFGYDLNSEGYVIGDTIFVDADGDGTVDAGEPGIPGVTVALKNSSGDVIATTITDSSGNYTFPGLLDGDYTVWVNDTKNVLGELTLISEPSFGGNGDGTSSLTLSGSDDLAQDFGYAPWGHIGSKGIIGDTIYLDRDGGTDFDAGEGLEGITVELYDDAGTTLLADTTTDENGHYYFGNLDDATYTVKVDTSTLPAGLTNTVDPDGIPANESSVTIAGGNADFDQDFGYQDETNPNTISGTIWEDTNADGTLDGGEAGRHEGVTVVIYDSNGDIIATTTTDASGNYSFPELADGTYSVDVTDEANVLNGYWHSDGPSNGSYNNSQDDPYSVTVTGGQTNTTADFGYYVETGTIGNLVWFDINKDGFQDGNEPGIKNVDVNLVITYPNGDAITIVTTTDGSGYYSYDNLLADESFNVGDNTGATPTYTVSVAAPPSMSLAPENAQAPGNNDQIDGDSDGADEIATILQGESDASYDFGFYGDPDLGDLPDGIGGSPPYDTYYRKGPSHIVFPDGGDPDSTPDTTDGVIAVWLGLIVDTEADGQPTVNADGDGIDEDGLDFASTGYTAGHSQEVTITLNSSEATTVYYGLWVDWDLDGNFDDFYNGSGGTSSPVEVQQSINVPGDYSSGSSVYWRLRASDSPLASIDYNGTLPNGEVEDYLQGFGPTAVTLSSLKAKSSGLSTSSILYAAVLLMVAVLGGLIFLNRRRRI